MLTALEAAVHALSDPAVALPDALRRLLVVSRRIQADDLTNWLRGELNGFSGSEMVPDYRQGQHLPIRLHFDGPMHSSTALTVTAAELPSDLASVMDGIAFREPVAELQELASGSDDPQLQLPMAWIEIYRKFATSRTVPSIEMFVLNGATIVTPQTHLKGVLDRIRSTALDLVLSLEHVSGMAGDTDGPTVASEPKLAEQITVHLTQLFADGSTITIGDNSTVASGNHSTAMSIAAGDIGALLKAAAALLQEDGVKGLAAALEADGGQPREATHGFLDRVRAGVYALAADVTTSAAYNALIALLHQAFPGVFT